MAFGASVEIPEEERKAVILPVGTVHEGDFFALANTVEISGVVKGDAYILGSQVLIDGTVEGDVLALGGSIEIAGDVANNIRVVAGQVMLTGKVAENATIVGANVQGSPGSAINGNVVCIAGNVDIASTLKKNLTLVASNSRIAGKILGTLNAFVGQLRLTSKSFVGGDVEYNSGSAAWVDPGAVIKGTLTHRPSFIKDIVKGNWINAVLLGSKLAALLMNFLYSLFIGFLLIRYFPRNLDSVLEALSDKPLKSLGVGIMILVLFPLVSLLLLMTILGVPFALTLIALNVVTFYTAKTYTIIWVSNHLCRKIKLKPNRVTTYGLGLILYFLLVNIPFIGTPIALATMLFGIGAGILAQMPKPHHHHHHHHHAAPKKPKA